MTPLKTTEYLQSPPTKTGNSQFESFPKASQAPNCRAIGGPGGALPPPAWRAPWRSPRRGPRRAAGGTTTHKTLPTLLLLLFLCLPVFGDAAYRDMDGDGFPDSAELISESDRRNFRRWFVSIAQSQFYGMHPHWPDARRDCAGLVCFAYKEALKKHDKKWLKGFKYLTDVAIPDVQAFNYPQVPVLGTGLFRAAHGVFSVKDLENKTFLPMSAAHLLEQYNCRFLGKEMDENILPGDLLFFRYEADGRIVFHTMILVKPLPPRGAVREGGRSFDGIVVYHTGSDGDDGDEMRRVRLSHLNDHPDDTWRVNPGNPHFLGFYRFNILDYRFNSGGPIDENK